MAETKEEYKFTNECRKVFQYMKDTIASLYPGRRITAEHYILSVADNKDCAAYKILSELMISDNLSKLWKWCTTRAESNVGMPIATMSYDKTFDKCLSELSGSNESISSDKFLCALIKDNEDLSKTLSVLGVSVSQIEHESEKTAQEKPKTETQTVKKGQKPKAKPSKATEKPSYELEELEKYLTNLNKMASDGKIDEAIGNDSLIETILTTLLKRDKNNAILVGDVGSGKTTTVMHIANKINEGSVGSAFENKNLMLMDFMSLVSGTGYRGGFETKYEAIVSAAKKNGNCIIVIDDVHSILGQNSKFSEISTDTMLDKLLSEKRIPCICTTTYEGYSKTIQNNEILNSRFEKIEMPKRNKEEIGKVATRAKEKYEIFHNVKITDKFVRDTINACERFMPNYGLSTVLEVIDMSASIERMNEKQDDTVSKLKEELQEIETEIEKVNSSTDASKMKEYDNLTKKKIAKKTEISVKAKELSLSKKPSELTEKHLLAALSQKTGLPVGELSKEDTEKLSSLSKDIKKDVIGQDEAVDEVCSAIRRQRSGLSDRNKPQVFLFVGRTGTGKTFLAKKLSEKVYGSERNLIRMDMSEYSDKTSVNKLTGASSGYVGYDDGGVLTESIKKNRHCIVLLDEIEKANDSVFDVFLQVFDEGRLTDNKGVTVDFSDTIIIMTSNIGMKEIEDRGNTVGFGRNTDTSYDKDIVLKTIKKRFKPEFINRVSNIIYFNSLTDENLRKIVENELRKLGSRVENAGYKLSKDVFNGKTVEKIMENVNEEKEYGARPIIRAIEHIVEDRIADLIIDGNKPKGYEFSDDDISN